MIECIETENIFSLAKPVNDDLGGFFFFFLNSFSKCKQQISEETKATRFEQFLLFPYYFTFEFFEKYRNKFQNA